MTDKEKIREEIEKVKVIIQSNRAQGAFAESYLIGQESVLEHFANFVNSMQEEPVSEDLDLGCGVIWKGEEPVSEDLEEALECKIRAIFDSLEKFDINDKEKNRVAFGLIELEAYAKMFYNIGKQAGAQWQKQQMKKDAIEAEYWACSLILDGGMRDMFEDGDKVKLIIIKEDEQ